MKSSAFVRAGVLSSLGVKPAEERIYIELLTRDGAILTELAHELRLPRTTVGRALGSLEEKALITHSPARVRRYFAVPADICVEALIERRQSELLHARSAITQLRAVTSATARRADERLVEVLSSHASVSAVSQMVKAAKTEILCLERLPLLISPATALEDACVHSLRRGVKARTVTDSSLLHVPGVTARLRKEAAAGEQKRIFSGLPFKLLVVDRRVGVVPLYLDSAAGPCLIVRSSSLLQALCELFEVFWRTATPFGFDDSGNFQVGSAMHGIGDESSQLLALLASGLNDKTIKHELDMSQRTFSRRITELMENLGATTRFRAGWLAAQSQRDCDLPAK